MSNPARTFVKVSKHSSRRTYLTHMCFSEDIVPKQHKNISGHKHTKMKQTHKNDASKKQDISSLVVFKIELKQHKNTIRRKHTQIDANTQT